MKDYIKWIRLFVKNKCIILNFAGAVIENEVEKILPQKRGDCGERGVPGGAMEIGKSSTDSVVRKVKEETGLLVESINLIGIYKKYFNKYPKW